MCDSDDTTYDTEISRSPNGSPVSVIDKTEFMKYDGRAVQEVREPKARGFLGVPTFSHTSRVVEALTVYTALISPVVVKYVRIECVIFPK